MKNIKFAAFLLFACFAVFACSQNETANSTGAVNANKTVNTGADVEPTPAIDEIASGKNIYAQSCARCHKDDGSGGKTEIEGKTINAENLITEKQKKESDADYVEAIEKGFPEDGMPAFKGRLTDQQIKEVVNYIRRELQKQ